MRIRLEMQMGKTAGAFLGLAVEESKMIHKYLVLLPLVLFALSAPPAAADSANSDKCPPNIGKFRVGIQTYTFRGNTFEEAIQKVASLGLTYAEAYPGQALSASLPGQKVDAGASPEAIAKMKEILSKNKVKLHNFGVVGLPNNEAECRKVFNFAREMGIHIIVSEPPDDAWPLIERLVKEFDIKVAVHNHASPSHYHDPRVTAKAVEGLDKRIGAAPDTGHWMRSGFDPVKSLKLLEGRVLSLHLKDLKEMNVKDTRDWPFGEGIGDVRGILEELERQKFDGLVAIEYEASQPDPTEDVAKCVAYLRKILPSVGIHRAGQGE